MRSTILFTATLLLTVSSAFSATYYIKADGTGDFPDIQSALTAGLGGDVVVVADGEYSGTTNLDFSGKAIVLMSENGPRNCSLSTGLGGGRIFVFENAEGPGTIVDGFTIEGGESPNGSGVFIQGASPTIVNNIIKNNYATDLGGGIYITGTTASPEIINNLIEYNEADEGGGIYNDGGHPVLRNNTIAYNEAPFGAGMRFDGLAGVTVTDNIFWGNYFGGQVAGGISGTFTNNLIENWSGPADNFPGNPHFTTGPDGDRYLGVGSDAIDAGSVPAADRCYTTGRGLECMDNMTASSAHSPDAGTLDVGFHYGPLPHTFNVPGDFPTIQAALDAAWPGDTVQLREMTYTGPGNRDLDFHGKAVTLRGLPAYPEDCVIDCEGSPSAPHRGIWFHSGEGAGTVVDGVRFMNGYAADSGGGIFCEGSSPTLIRVFLTNCIAALDGGGLACIDYSSPVLNGCLFDQNEAGDDGGGLFARNFSSPDVDACIFRRNIAAARGGGALFVVNSFPTVDRSWFYTNSAAKGGGLAFVYAYGPVTDCIIYANEVTETGGGMECYGNAQCTMTRCTIVQNSAPAGAGVWCRNNSSPSFANVIIAFNANGQGVGRYDTDCNPAFSCTDIYGNDGGDWIDFMAPMNMVDGNFSGDPYFCSLQYNRYTLGSTSPCAADNNPACGQIGALGVDCVVSGVDDNLTVRLAARLIGSYPNPFNPQTTIAYDLPTQTAVNLHVYDLSGRLVKVLLDGEIVAQGRNEAIWNGRDDTGRRVASGAYFYRLEAGEYSETKRVALIK